MLANQFMRAQTQAMVSSGQEQQLSKLFDATAGVMYTSEKNLSFMSSSKEGSSSSIGQSIPFFNVSRPLPMVHSSNDCEASKLLVVSNLKMDAKRSDEPNNKKKRKRNPSKSQERNCVYCRDTCNEIERAKECPGRVGGKSCPHRMVANLLEMVE